MTKPYLRIVRPGNEKPTVATPHRLEGKEYRARDYLTPVEAVAEAAKGQPQRGARRPDCVPT